MSAILLVLQILVNSPKVICPVQTFQRSTEQDTQAVPLEWLPLRQLFAPGRSWREALLGVISPSLPAEPSCGRTVALQHSELALERGTGTLVWLRDPLSPALSVLIAAPPVGALESLGKTGQRLPPDHSYTLIITKHMH